VIAEAAMEEKKPEFLSSFFADRIFGFNPFPKDDARRVLWETNASHAAEELARMEAKVWRTLPAETAPSEEFLAHALDSAGGFFDIWARRLLIITVNGPASVALYEECLISIISSLLQKNRVADKGRFGLSKEKFLLELRIRFMQRKADWTAEAVKIARDSEQANSSNAAQSEPRSDGAKAATKFEARIQQQERKGYRLEIQEWMQRQGLTTLEQASKKLAVGLSTLKSIMTDKGSPRYSTRTLDTVLSKIGHRRAKM
jgi:hypothetical protein